MASGGPDAGLVWCRSRAGALLGAPQDLPATPDLGPSRLPGRDLGSRHASPAPRGPGQGECPRAEPSLAMNRTGVKSVCSVFSGTTGIIRKLLAQTTEHQRGRGPDGERDRAPGFEGERGAGVRGRGPGIEAERGGSRAHSRLRMRVRPLAPAFAPSAFRAPRVHPLATASAASGFVRAAPGRLAFAFAAS